MRTLYFDCFAGISGDMTLGALVAAGVDAFALKEHLALLDLAGYEISFEQVERSGISATRAIVRVTGEEKRHRHLSDISEIILALIYVGIIGFVLDRIVALIATFVTHGTAAN